MKIWVCQSGFWNCGRVEAVLAAWVTAFCEVFFIINLLSSWTTDVPEDVLFVVSVTRLDGPDGEPLYEYNEKTLEKKRERLRVLEEKYTAEI